MLEHGVERIAHALYRRHAAKQVSGQLPVHVAGEADHRRGGERGDDLEGAGPGEVDQHELRSGRRRLQVLQSIGQLEPGRAHQA